MIESLMEAMRDRLREQLNIDHKLCEVRPDGKPPATMGEYFVSIDEGPIQSTERGSLKEQYTVMVFVTRRAGVFPDDRTEKAYLNQSRLLTQLERKVVAAIHGRQEVRLLANKFLARDAAQGSGEFTWPMYWTGRQKTDKKTGWILGESPEQLMPCMVRQLPFVGGMRIQNLDTIQ